MARKGEIEIQFPWWIAGLAVAGAYFWFKSSSAPAAAPYPYPDPYGAALSGPRHGERSWIESGYGRAAVRRAFSQES